MIGPMISLTAGWHVQYWNTSYKVCLQHGLQLLQTILPNHGGVLMFPSIASHSHAMHEENESHYRHRPFCRGQNPRKFNLKEEGVPGL